MISSTASADLFASPVNAAADPAPSFSFGSAGSHGDVGGGRHTHGNGAAAGGGLTGQRHENSVLFSLSNLEALAAPNAAAPSMSPRPGVSGPTEGSGLIDIRSMAAMTLGSQNENRLSNDLPTFGAPQFSPVAPVLLPIGAPAGPSKWIVALIVVGLLVAVAIGGATYFLARTGSTASIPVTKPEPATLPTATPPPTTAPTPPPTAAHPATPPATPPASATEVLPPREPTKSAAASDRAPKGGRKSSKGSKGGRPTDVAAATERPSAAAAPERPAAQAPEKPNIGKRDKLDELLDGALGSKPKATPRPRDEEEAPSRRSAPAAAASLPALEKGDIVRAMMAINGKIKDCYNQYKVPGTAMVNIKLARGGRVSDASVSGKFAGTPTGTCVESAVKSAKFPPTEAQGFAYPFPLH
jgi:hypothetical protein